MLKDSQEAFHFAAATSPLLSLQHTPPLSSSSDWEELYAYEGEQASLLLSKLPLVLFS